MFWCAPRVPRMPRVPRVSLLSPGDHAAATKRAEVDVAGGRRPSRLRRAALGVDERDRAWALRTTLYQRTGWRGKHAPSRPSGARSGRPTSGFFAPAPLGRPERLVALAPFEEVGRRHRRRMLERHHGPFRRAVLRPAMARDPVPLGLGRCGDGGCRYRCRLRCELGGLVDGEFAACGGSACVGLATGAGPTGWRRGGDARPAWRRGGLRGRGGGGETPERCLRPGLGGAVRPRAERIRHRTVGAPNAGVGVLAKHRPALSLCTRRRPRLCRIGLLYRIGLRFRALRLVRLRPAAEQTASSTSGVEAASAPAGGSGRMTGARFPPRSGAASGKIWSTIDHRGLLTWPRSADRASVVCLSAAYVSVRSKD